jgi:hypothetical protein
VLHFVLGIIIYWKKKKRQRPCTRKVYKRYSHTKGVENPKSLLDLKDSKGEMGKIEYSPIQKEVSKRHILTKQTRLTRLEKYQSLIFFQRHCTPYFSTITYLHKQFLLHKSPKPFPSRALLNSMRFLTPNPPLETGEHIVFSSLR